MTAPRVESNLDGPAPDAPTAAAVGVSGVTGGATRLAERAVLATLLYRPDRMADLELWLRAGDFADPHHAAIYTTIARLRTVGELRSINVAEASVLDPTSRSRLRSVTPANVLAVQEALHAGRFIDTPLQHSDVRELLSAVPTDDADFHVRYGQMVLESSARRRLQAWAVYFEQPARAPYYGAETRELSPVHDGLVNDLADFRQRTDLSRVSPDLAAFAQLSEMVAPTMGGPLVVPAAAPARKLVERAERDVLTAVLSNNGGRHQLLDRFEPADFTASARHAATWRAIQSVAYRGEPVNAITVAWETERLHLQPGPALSADELVDLAAAPAPASLRRQTTTIARASLYYRVQHAGDQLDRAAHDRSHSVDQMLSKAQHTAATLHEHASRLAGQRAPVATAHRIAQQLDGPTNTRQR